MVNTKQVETIETLPRLHALTLTDDGSPAKDKTVSHFFNAITICNIFLGTRITKTRHFFLYLLHKNN